MSSKRLTNPASTSLEQSISPAAGGPLTYDAHNIGEFDAARKEADDYCYKENDLKRAAYVRDIRESQLRMRLEVSRARANVGPWSNSNRTSD